MARIQYIFSNPRGSIDNITFSKIRKTAYAKKKIQKNTSNTPKQQEARSAFSLAVGVVSKIQPLIKQGFCLYTGRMSSYNAALQHIMKNALTPDRLEIDYSKVLISKGGSLSPAVNATAYSDSGSIVFEWDTTGSSSANANDKSLICLINPANNEVVFNDAGADRSTGIQSIRVSPLWTGKVHAYIGFVSEDQKNVATSTYLGEITIA